MDKHSRKWCRGCDDIRDVHVEWDADAWVCLTCHIRTTGKQEWDRQA